MKKVFLLVFSFVLAAALIACGGPEQSSTAAPSSNLITSFPSAPAAPGAAPAMKSLLEAGNFSCEYHPIENGQTTGTSGTIQAMEKGYRIEEPPAGDYEGFGYIANFETKKMYTWNWEEPLAVEQELVIMDTSDPNRAVGGLLYTLLAPMGPLPNWGMATLEVGEAADVGDRSATEVILEIETFRLSVFVDDETGYIIKMLMEDGTGIEVQNLHFGSVEEEVLSVPAGYGIVQLPQ